MGDVAVELAHVIEAYEQLGDCEVVHDHTVAGPLYSARFPALPVVTTNHGPFSWPHDVRYARVHDRVPIIAISHDQARRANGIRVSAVIHHGLDATEYPMGDGDGDYLLFLGRMDEGKGAHRAIAIARAAGRPLLIAAKMRSAAERAYFRERVAPLLDDAVRYVGEVGGRRKRELLAGASALVNPIRWPEPFGLVMIEALACGTPVLAFAEGAAPELVDHGVTGFICQDEAEMVRRIRQIGCLDRANCRASVERRFSVERMVAAHVDVYRRAVAHHGRRAA
jgi:glycosyltransferase involved in cell wall biosynthesis